MDPEGEQESEDNRQDTFEQQEEFEHLDPDCLELPPKDTFEESFHPIQVRPLQEILKDVRKLDFFQRKVIDIGIKHARGLVKDRGGKNPLPLPTLCMIDGAAGSGKS